MTTNTLLRRHRRRILDLAREHGAERVSVFGSVARGEARPDSDVDLLVRMTPGRTLLDLAGLALDLETLLGRRVDLVSEGGLTGDVGERIRRSAHPL